MVFYFFFAEPVFVATDVRRWTVGEGMVFAVRLLTSAATGAAMPELLLLSITFLVFIVVAVFFDRNNIKAKRSDSTKRVEKAKLYEEAKEVSQ